MPERMRIILPGDKVSEAKRIAVERNRKEGVFGGMNYGSVRGSLEAHHLGMLGEMAVAHHFGLVVDDVIYDRHGDDGRDLFVPGFGNCQIKATTYPSAWLRVETHKRRDNVDAYFCVYVGRGSLETWLVGWATRYDVERKLPRRCHPSGPLNFILREEELRQIPVVSVLAPREMRPSPRPSPRIMEANELVAPEFWE